MHIRRFSAYFQVRRLDGARGKDMSDLYDKIREDVPFRKMWAEKSGFGFELPSVVPNVPKKEDQLETTKAA
jgi:hypothetical protein